MEKMTKQRKAVQVWLYLSLLYLCSALPLQAQVTVGSDKAPESFSVLELINDQTVATGKGLRLPQVTMSQRTAMETAIAALTPAQQALAVGLQIYNTDHSCVETWNGSAWISMCEGGTQCADLAAPTTVYMGGKAAKNMMAYTPVVLEDVSADFSTGFSIPAYQWYSSTVGNNTDPSASTSTLIPGATSSSYTATGLTQGTGTATYYYFCVVSNGACPTAPSMASGVYTVNVVAPPSCGAYTAKDKTIATTQLSTASNITWRQFMCYNLGADYNLDPFTPAKGLNGSYYQWNRKVPVADVNTPQTYPGTWPAGDATATEWTAANDPCPAGFRVPTQAEWQGIINDTRNTITNAPGSTWASDGNFISGKLFGTAMYLPAASSRSTSNGSLGSRGAGGDYWSGSQSGDAFSLNFNSTLTPTMYNNSRSYGFSVRCIADEIKSNPKITTQPRAFLFNETGSGNFLTTNPDTGVQEAASSLSIVVAPASPNWTYQWYTLNNNRNAIGMAIRSAISGATNASFTPTDILKGVTTNGNNVGFYRYQCIATLHDGTPAGPVIETLTSDIAEVAVGCGAKTVDGDWLSFMCFNLGVPSPIDIKHQTGEIAGNSVTPGTDGTLTVNPGEQAMWGSLFQWGRIADGHEIRSSGILSYGTLGAGDLKSGSNCVNDNNTFPFRQIRAANVDATTPAASAWYGKFISGTISNWSPDAGTYNADQLWHVGRYLPNDPCAHINQDGISYTSFWTTAPTDACPDPGTNWRMPSLDDWGSIYRRSFISIDASAFATANTWSWLTATVSGNGNAGYQIKPDGTTTTLFLPASGYRPNGGNFYNQGIIGDYWSTNSIEANNANANNLFFMDGIVRPIAISARSYGFSVRCIKNKY
jgi:uncharacterized protein (TIGR02145 family)